MIAKCWKIAKHIIMGRLLRGLKQCAEVTDWGPAPHNHTVSSLRSCCSSQWWRTCGTCATVGYLHITESSEQFANIALDCSVAKSSQPAVPCGQTAVGSTVILLKMWAGQAFISAATEQLWPPVPSTQSKYFSVKSPENLWTSSQGPPRPSAPACVSQVRPLKTTVLGFRTSVPQKHLQTRCNITPWLLLQLI